jgi:hypothetical protein
LTQPASLLAIVGGVDPASIGSFWHRDNCQKTQELLAQLRAAGFEPSYSRPSLFHVRDDLYVLMANHQYNVRADDASAITRATLRARREIDESVRALRSLGGPWAKLFVIATAEQIGIREGRRIRGRDTVVGNDLLTGRRRDDAVVHATFGMDLHSLDPAVSKAIDPQARSVLPYDIPYGSLVAADVDALLLAGRCISGDFMAHSSYRVTGNAAAMGDAAGRAAAVCAKTGRLPHELAWSHSQGSAALDSSADTTR